MKQRKIIEQPQNRCFWIFGHIWSNWKRKEEIRYCNLYSMARSTTTWQERKCSNCDKVQIRSLRKKYD